MAAPFLRQLRAILTGGISAFGMMNGFGYATGGAVTQLTSKATAVALTAWSGQITTSNAALNTATSVAFTLTNANIAATSEVTVWFVSGNTANSYTLQVDAIAAGSCSISIRNYTGGNLSEALVIGFAVRPAAIA